VWPEPRRFSLGKEKLRKIGIPTSVLLSSRKPTGKGGKLGNPAREGSRSAKVPEEPVRASEVSPGWPSPARNSGKGGGEKGAISITGTCS
jgi:hypothetical protein